MFRWLVVNVHFPFFFFFFFYYYYPFLRSSSRLWIQTICIQFYWTSPKFFFFFFLVLRLISICGVREFMYVRYVLVCHFDEPCYRVQNYIIFVPFLSFYLLFLFFFNFICLVVVFFYYFVLMVSFWFSFLRLIEIG